MIQLEWTDKGLAFRALMLKLQDYADRKVIAISSNYIEMAMQGEPSVFDMNTFCSTNGDDAVTDESIHKCGAVACALGWSTLMIEPSPYSETFEGYISRVLLVNRLTEHELSALADWLFEGKWAGIAPNPRDVVTRFDYVSTPAGFERVMTAFENSGNVIWNFWGSQVWLKEGLANGKVV